MAKKDEEAQSRIRIRVQAYDNKIIDQASKKIVETALRAGCAVMGPVPLPTKKHKVTVNRSTFKFKKARDQYETRVHKRLIDIVNPNPQAVESLTNIDLPAGVDVEIKM